MAAALPSTLAELEGENLLLLLGGGGGGGGGWHSGGGGGMGGSLESSTITRGLGAAAVSDDERECAGEDDEVDVEEDGEGGDELVAGEGCDDAEK